MKQRDYVHGYSTREAQRLADQANTLVELLHRDSIYSPNERILEAGCGVGAQTITLAANSPKSQFVCIDISADSLEQAHKLTQSKGITNVEFQQADVFDLPFEPESFDHVFVCFLLEHLEEPIKVLLNLKKVLRRGGTLTAIEGDHGSAYFYPDSEYAKRAIQCLIDLQAEAKGNSLIGRQLCPLLKECGFKDIKVSPRVVYADSSRPQMVKGFTKNTFTAMVDGVKEQAIGSGMIDEKSWEKGIADLYRSAEDDGVFNYTFFKAVGVK
ncbi:MAG: methyltransferase domain-containing protein [Phycisphaerales bacterium]|jgi:SAM-dependent methyltransferase